ncbi:MAG: hypothetical protein COZ91_01635 [Candidatus Nealsonbacteria bacterium CG_4_8_14_3_um_filter_39_7]|uniref:PilN domain-containing protein n=1 Tax=Candidatus Nealsonbacteria bacterium CG23_combo_of_CG06-09_8_20_14_all_39_17 TaxID=1974722 RepID=A0A2G9YV00_9BACT|nr:MAG: hypothetical protein COX37_00880 [Candidatus Nealsonbacteria bacterium CG23_combo_of_CG06-09_8_20_14_all_39_17]PIU44035.1 MAG: hypothetical protein COS96_01135 [Candidatus Nealsonbacteria bacterium CG07_land_8_20_14_0_80_39_13]PIW91217.1 MAG: hypothetical protein COZ91_01635 [Candidatus Nealsonbacteria bacterium CG_4_8_14_3_um_filter_39_7]
MINFLPEAEKQKTLERKKWKIISILGVICLSALICLFLSLFFVNNLIQAKAEGYKVYSEQQKKESSHWGETEKKISVLNSSFSDLASFYESQHNISFLIERVFDNMPITSYLSNFSFVRLERKKSADSASTAEVGQSEERKEEFWAEVSISGFCPTREDLLSLKSNLENEKIFEKRDIYFPASGWVKAEDVNFIATINVKKTFDDIRQ